MPTEDSTLISDEKELEATSSSIVADADVKQEGVDNTASTEDSSSSTDVDHEKSISDVALETWQKHQDKLKSDSSTDKTTQSTEEKDKTIPDKDKTTDTTKVDDKDKQLPFHNHPRFQELVKEKNDYKTKVETFQQEQDRTKPAIEWAKGFSDYCQKNQIDDGLLNTALEIAALSKMNPTAAVEKLRSHLESLEVSIGSKLPMDIQKKLDEGLIDDATAKELSSLRVKSLGLEHTTKATQQSIEQQRQKDIIAATNTWDASKQQSDPEYPKRREMIEDRLKVLWNQTPPQSAQEVVSLAEQAYQEVNKRLSSVMPRARAQRVIDPTRGGRTNGHSNGDKVPAFKSLDDTAGLLATIRSIAARHVASR